MNQENDYSIEPFNQIHKEEVLNLVSEEWSKFNREYFDWKFLNNPYYKSVGYVVLYNGKIVGFRGVMGANFTLNNKPLNFLSMADGVIAKEHRRKGLFTKITNYMLTDLYKNSDIKLVYSLSSVSVSSKSYLKKGWQVLGKKRIFVYKNLSGFLMNKGMKFRIMKKASDFLSILQNLKNQKMASFFKDYKLLISELAYPNILSNFSFELDNKIHQKKNIEFLKWKFSNPQKDMRYVFSYLFNPENKLVSYLVFHVSEMDYFLVDYDYKDNINYLKISLDNIVRKNKNSFFFTWTFGINDNELEKAGFFRNSFFSKFFPKDYFSSSLPIVINTTNPSSKAEKWIVDGLDVRQIHNWSINMIDSD